MRHDAPLPATPALPLNAARAGLLGDPRDAPVTLDPRAVADFNALLHELHPDAPHVEAAAIASVARWLVELPPAQSEALLQARLGRLQELRDLAVDPDWGLEPALARRIYRLLDYVSQPRDLIPDDVPRVGRLDDALLVELAWPAFADETLDYGDFCRFRAEARPRGTPRERRLAWETACLAEVALIQQRRQVRARHYIGGEPLPALFRVS